MAGQMNQLETPVALIVFNRPEQTHRVFDVIAKARPSRLMIIADGPRRDRQEEAERCAEVRQIVSKVDWPCELDLNLSDENLGCRRRVITGLNWVFSLVEEAIILEDDCLPDPSFFPFCSELLERYRDQHQIGFIAGFNPLEKKFPFEYSYFFSLVTGIWGWATWRRAWQEYDEHISNWPAIKEAGLLHLLFPDKKVVAYWSRVFDAMYHGTGPNTWDYQWLFTCWTRNWLSVLSGRNLVQNIGFGEEATHTTSIDSDLKLPPSQMKFPLRHPPAILPWNSHVMEIQELLFTPGLMRRIRRKWSAQSTRRTA